MERVVGFGVWGIGLPGLGLREPPLRYQNGDHVLQHISRSLYFNLSSGDVSQ